MLHWADFNCKLDMCLILFDAALEDCRLRVVHILDARPGVFTCELQTWLMHVGVILSHLPLRHCTCIRCKSKRQKATGSSDTESPTIGHPKN